MSVSKSANSSFFNNKLQLGILFLSLFSLTAFLLFPSKSKPVQGEVCGNSISCVSDLSGKYDPNEKVALFNDQKVSVPRELAQTKPATEILGETSGGEKHIYVDLTSQTLYAKEGDKEVFSFPISSGKWYPTPTGDFRIWVKLRYTRMSGGNPVIHTYYNLPNVPFTMFYYNDQISKARGFSLHGAYWHDNFGHPMSHGCVNISIPNAEKLYNWVEPPATGNVTYIKDTEVSTPVTIYGTTPKEN